MEWKDHNEANLELILTLIKENEDTVEDLAEGTGFGRTFIDKFLDGTISPGPKLQEIILTRYHLVMDDGKVRRKS